MSKRARAWEMGLLVRFRRPRRSSALLTYEAPLRLRREHTDQVLREKFLNCLARKRAVNLQLLRDDRRCDQLLFGNIRKHLLVRGFVEEHKVRELLLDFALGPLLRAHTTGSADQPALQRKIGRIAAQLRQNKGDTLRHCALDNRNPFPEAKTHVLQKPMLPKPTRPAGALNLPP